MIVTINDFLYFIKERTTIRTKKQVGLTAPWSQDPVFQQTKFCNLDRNHDYGTKSLLDFTKGMNMVSTIFYIVMFRSCYSSRNFFPQMTGNWIVDMQYLKTTKLTNLGRMPYQIYLKKNQGINNFLYTTTFDVIKRLVVQMRSFNYTSIEDAADVIANNFKITHGKRLIFLGTEIAKDIAAIYPHKIDPDSWCHFNIGAQKTLKGLGRGKWKTKAQMLVLRTKLNPSTVENLCCEVGKMVERRDFYNLNGYFKKAWIYTPSSTSIQNPVLVSPVMNANIDGYKVVGGNSPFFKSVIGKPGYSRVSAMMKDAV